MTYFMAIQEIGVRSVNIACLHAIEGVEYQMGIIQMSLYLRNHIRN